MGQEWLKPAVMAVVLAALYGENVNGEERTISMKTVKSEKVCLQGWECSYYSQYCCNQTISDLFQTYQFENLFSKRNSPVAHAVGFWDYRSFITASTTYQPLGFGTTWWQVYADEGNCRIPRTCRQQNFLNYNYGYVGEALNLDLLDHPGWVLENAMWRWMTPIKKGQPSAHDVFVGNWKPTRNETDAKRVAGFGATMNIMYGGLTCGQGRIDPMNNIISHYIYYLDLMGVGREMAGPNEVLSCADQKPFNPVQSSTT